MDSTALYIHVPFCTGKCFYCSFYSILVSDARVTRYLRALAREAELIIETFFSAGRPRLESVYIGGGTPTVLAPEQIAELMRVIHGWFRLADSCEFTIEAGAETVTAEKIRALADAGVNRISLGAQSFDDPLLARIGRRHTSGDTRQAVRDVRSAGISNFSLDLIYGLPEQRLEQWREDLASAVELEPKHLACYELTVERGTAFEEYTRGPEDDALLADMFYLAKDVLEGAGFEHYELSNYALPHFQSRHNVRYWRNQSYIGLGPSGAGFLQGRRTTNVADLDSYCRTLLTRNELPVATAEAPTGLLLAGETAMLNLRMARGIEKGEFMARTGFDPFVLYAEPIQRLSAAGVIDVDGEHVRLSRKGLIVANEVMAEFLPG